CEHRHAEADRVQHRVALTQLVVLGRLLDDLGSLSHGRACSHERHPRARARESHARDSRIEQYRSFREEVERSVLPKATSVDGRRFEYQASLHDLELEAGGYVALEVPGEVRLGQVLSLRMDTVEVQSGDEGRLMLRLAIGNGDLLDAGRPFHDAPVRPATLDEVQAWQEHTRPPNASLAIG